MSAADAGGGDRQQGNSRSIERNRGMVGAWEEQGKGRGVEWEWGGRWSPVQTREMDL